MKTAEQMRELTAQVSSQGLLDHIERQIELMAGEGQYGMDYLVEKYYTNDDVMYCIDKLIDAGYTAYQQESSESFLCKLLITWNS